MEGQVQVWPCPFLCRRRVAGVRGAWPLPRECGKNSLSGSSCLTSWAAKASPYLFGVRCMRQAGRRVSCRRARPPASVGCVAWSRFVGMYEGVLLGKVGSPGVVVVDGWFRSRWIDAPGLPARGGDPRAVVSSPPLRMAGAGFASCVRGGPSSLQCRWPAVVGRARVCNVGWSGRSRVFLRVCSRFRLPVAQPPGGFPTRRTRTLQRALEISCTRAVCVASASISVWMVGCGCLPSASAWIEWIAKTAAQVGRSGGLCHPLALGDGLQLLPAVQVDRQGVPGLAFEYESGGVWQGRGRREYGVNGLQTPVALLRVQDDPQLVVVAIFQHDHGDGAAVTFPWRGRCACRLRVPLRHVCEVTPPVAGCPALPCRQAFVRWHAEGFGSWRWGGPFPAPCAGRGPGVRCWCYKRVCPAQVWDPYASLGWLVGVEPLNARFNKVVRDPYAGGDKRLELPHKDFGCCGVGQGDHGEEPVRDDVQEVFPEGCH